MNRYRVPADTPIDLSQWDPDTTDGFDGAKRDARKRVERLNKRLEELQELLYAQGRHKLLIVLQAMDCGGKDGTIRSVFDGVNPQGVKVASFKKPTARELAHDYLWRVHKHTPGRGEMVIFNRSHYEDVLVVRVHGLVPEEVWSKRYAHINSFEKLLADEGTTILKFFLHISPEEQRERLQERIDIPRKKWKFSHRDLEERKLWPDYQRAYEAVLSQTSKPWAPWYIVPANRNWFRNLVISEVLVQTLSDLNMSYPQPEEGLDGLVVQ